MPLVGTLARSSLFHTLVGRNLNILVPDSGAIRDSPQLRVSLPLTHIMSSNILEDCSQPQMGDCAHIHIGTQPSGEVSGQGWGEYRVQSLSHPLFRHTTRDDRSRGTDATATGAPECRDGRDGATRCRLSPQFSALQNHAISAGGTPPSQPADEGGARSSGAL